MGIVVTLANVGWGLSGYPAWRRFKKHSRQPESHQLDILRRLLSDNRDTEYGQKYGFDQITDHREYWTRVPLVRYDDIQDHILKMARGESGVLTHATINLLEPSGGSSGGVKYIPYTSPLSAEFRAGIQSWIFNLFANKPSLLAGSAYWSISPVNEIPQIPGATIPIGFNADSEYLSPLARRVMDQVLCVPTVVSTIKHIDAFRYVTLFYLLSARNLRLISVWNPTFLSLLLEALKDNWDDLLEDLEKGRIRHQVQCPAHILESLNSTLRPNPKRALELRRLGPEEPGLIWPDLRLISCWMDGAAEHFAKKLQADSFPHVSFQGKGLLATEGILSFPLIGKLGAVLSIDSHFYEFLPLDQHGEEVETDPRMAHQLEKGKQYTVVITTGGGLYRYRLDDIVEVTDTYNALPCFRFISKTDQFSDRFGEKLSEGFVHDCLTALFQQFTLDPAFYLIAPQEENGQTHYTLYVETPGFEPKTLKALEEALDASLRRNFHYDYSRKLGQLAQLKVTRIGAGSAARYLKVCHERGQKLGDIKPSTLNPHPGWETHFEVLG
jgi:hypothetical protein